VHERAVGAPAEGVGIFGKLPCRGDFITRGLPGELAERLHGLLHETITEGRRQHGDAWLDAYLTAPIWRFAATAGCLGETTCVGLLMPSVDAVGRHFPVAVLYRTGRARGATALLTGASAWLTEAEGLALSALDEALDADGLEAALTALAPPEAGRHEPPGAAAERGLPWRIPLGAVDGELSLEGCAELADRALGACSSAHSLWLTAGSDRMAPELRVFAGLPDVASLVTFVMGDAAPAVPPSPEREGTR